MSQLEKLGATPLRNEVGGLPAFDRGERNSGGPGNFRGATQGGDDVCYGPHGRNATKYVASIQGQNTIFGADRFLVRRHYAGMLNHASLLFELERLKAEGKTTNAQLARLLNIPTSRVAEIFYKDKKPRKITVDEAKLLAEEFGLDDRAGVPTAEELEPLLEALLPILPDGDPSVQSVRALSQALSYALELLGDRRANQPSQDALAVAARAAVARFRETALQ